MLGSDKSGIWSYHALTESLVKPEAFSLFFGHGCPRIDSCTLTAAAVKKHLQELGSLSWSGFGKGQDEFLRISLQEYSLTTEMEVLAYQRLGFARAIRSGKGFERKSLKTHGKRYQRMVKEFSKVWRQRNRPSRLVNNQQAFKNASKEMDRLLTR